MLVIIRGVTVDLPEDVADVLLRARKASLPQAQNLETRPGPLSTSSATRRGRRPGTASKPPSSPSA